ncbi:MAG: ABC transporter ATP-binding protein, partial [archaeon]|nr:ABC transporter ATP-binding protein [archaeon]
MLGRYPYLQNMWWETDEDETIVQDALKKFGVHHLQDRALNMLSSGERQRVLIAKAYVQNPRLMLVDEPTSHLDMKYKLDVMEYMKAMVRQDMTVLVAEHDISLMARYCDLCVIMKKGNLIAVGEPKEIITEELIRNVYDVEASVGTDKDGEIFVLPKRYVGEYHL